MQRGVRAGDDGERAGEGGKILATQNEIHFVLTEAGVNAVTDAAEAENGAMLQRGRQRHARGAPESGRAAVDAGAIGRFVQQHRRGGLTRK